MVAFHVTAAPYSNLTSRTFGSYSSTPGEDTWADPLEKATDLRDALRYRHLKTGEDWCSWLTTMATVQQRLPVQRVIKHHRISWQRMRRDYEVAKATQEARSGRPQRAINLIFGKEGPTMVDGAFWKQQVSTDASGTTGTRTEWIYVTNEDDVEEEALRHVSRMFPPQLGWEPYKPGATFPEGYAFQGLPVVSMELSHILTRVDRVDFTGVLDPITLADFDSLLRKWQRLGLGQSLSQRHRTASGPVWAAATRRTRRGVVEQPGVAI